MSAEQWLLQCHTIEGDFIANKCTIRRVGGRLYLLIFFFKNLPKSEKKIGWKKLEVKIKPHHGHSVCSIGKSPSWLVLSLFSQWSPILIPAKRPGGGYLSPVSMWQEATRNTTPLIVCYCTVVTPPPQPPQHKIWGNWYSFIHLGEEGHCEKYHTE